MKRWNVKLLKNKKKKIPKLFLWKNFLFFCFLFHLSSDFRLILSCNFFLLWQDSDIWYIKCKGKSSRVVKSFRIKVRDDSEGKSFREGRKGKRGRKKGQIRFTVERHSQPNRIARFFSNPSHLSPLPNPSSLKLPR